LCQSTILARTEEDKGLKYKCYSQRDDGLDGLHSISFHVAPGLWFNRIGNRIEDIMIWPCLWHHDFQPWAMYSFSNIMYIYYINTSIYIYMYIFIYTCDYMRLDFSSHIINHEHPSKVSPDVYDFHRLWGPRHLDVFDVFLNRIGAALQSNTWDFSGILWKVTTVGRWGGWSRRSTKWLWQMKRRRSWCSFEVAGVPS